MGNDGGSIPRRDELVRMKKKPEEVYGNCIFYFISTLLPRYLFLLQM